MTLHELYPEFPSGFPLPFILDGATGTALMRAGMPRGVCTETWVLEHPAVLEELQRGYIKSGADGLLAPTFGANSPSLARHGASHTEELNEALAALSLGVCRGGGCLTGGDMSPTGLFLEPYGDATFEELAAVYAEQAAALERAGVDFFMIETGISLAEVRAAVTGVKSVSARPVFVTLTVDANGRTMSGDALDASLVTLAPLGISAFGANCSSGPNEMLRVLEPLVPLSLAFGIPLIAKPNAGMPRELEDGSSVFELTAEAFGEYAARFLESGIFVLGGCCGTDSGHIAALRAAAEAIAPDTGRLAALPRPEPGRLAATPRTVAELDLAAIASGEAYPVSEELTDLDGEDDYLAVRLETPEDAELLYELSAGLTSPLVLRGDEKAVSAFLRVYNGRALVTGR